MVLREAQRRQAELKTAVKTTLRQGWVSRNKTVYYYLPSLKNMMLEWTLARRWLLVEAEEVKGIYQGRKAEPQARHKISDIPPNRLGEWVQWHSKVIWSRWSLNDSRTDPDGREPFCLGEGHEIFHQVEDEAPDWKRMARWFISS